MVGRKNFKINFRVKKKSTLQFLPALTATGDYKGTNDRSQCSGIIFQYEFENQFIQ